MLQSNKQVIVHTQPTKQPTNWSKVKDLFL